MPPKQSTKLIRVPAASSSVKEEQAVDLFPKSEPVDPKAPATEEDLTLTEELSDSEEHSDEHDSDSESEEEQADDSASQGSSSSTSSSSKSKEAIGLFLASLTPKQKAAYEALKKSGVVREVNKRDGPKCGQFCLDGSECQAAPAKKCSKCGDKPSAYSHCEKHHGSQCGAPLAGDATCKKLVVGQTHRCKEHAKVPIAAKVKASRKTPVIHACTHVYQRTGSGKNAHKKGDVCGKECVPGTKLCKPHTKVAASGTKKHTCEAKLKDGITDCSNYVIPPEKICGTHKKVAAKKA